MKNTALFIFWLYYWFNFAVAFVQGGFWWIVFNLLIPIAIPVMIAEKFVNYMK